MFRKLLRHFMSDKRAEAIDYGMFVGLAIAIVIAINLVPTIVTTVNDTDTSTWDTDFVGGGGAEALFQLIVLVFIAGIVIWVIKKVLS